MILSARQLHPRTFSRFAGRVLAILLFCAMTAAPVHAATRLIVRTSIGGQLLTTVCRILGCNVEYGLGDDKGQLFLLTSPLDISARLRILPGIVTVELDTIGQTLAGSQADVPPALYDKTPVSYYGATVRRGYVNQPAAAITRVSAAQGTFGVAGTGIVAVIDTGVDATHPVLSNVLLPGYDFTRNRASADEKGDIGQSTTAVIDQTNPAEVNQSTTAVIDTYSASQLNQPKYQGFGHGTMVSGVIHLVAPKALILPLKAFRADGTGYASDIIRAIYYAVRHQARILNMSFSFDSSSAELYQALVYAELNGVISVAAAGNQGKDTIVYPAGYNGVVMGVASTSNSDLRSSFSNYGQRLVWVAAPGEGVVTLYPFSTYAAVWGTSFSTPFVAGAAALLLDVHQSDQQHASQAFAHAKYIDKTLGNGRLDIYQAVQAYLQSR
ncbi:MAG: fervidolysin [Candidatus Solibacter sp.]|nr:fervidolysin [Candidatus Solibacter sp.]